MSYVVLNNARTTIAGVVSIGATSIPVASGEGALFNVGSNHSYVTLEDTAGHIETVKLTARAGDVLTTAPTVRAWAIGDLLECRPCAEAMPDLHAADIENASAKTTPVDADLLGLVDSAASFVLKKISWANIKAALQSTLAFIQSGSGAVATSVQAKLRESVSVRDFGAVGDGVANDAPAIALALAASDVVQVNSGFTCKIGTTVSVASGKTLFAFGDAKLIAANGLDNQVLQIASGAAHVTIAGLEIDGNKANNTGGCGIACTGLGATYVMIKDCYVHDCDADGIRFVGSSALKYINCYGNTLEANGSAGMTSDDTIQFFTWHGNISRYNGTHGIGLIGIGKHGTISANTCLDNGQGSPNADNLTGYNALCEDLTISSNVSYGGLNNGIHFGGNRISYIGNVVQGAAQYGLAHSSSASATSNGVVMIGNNVYNNAGAAGILVEKALSGTINGNTSNNNAAGHGVLIDGCSTLSISGNQCKSNGVDGIRNNTASSTMTITGNTCANNAGDGIEITNATSSTVSGNTCISNTGYGINSTAGDADNVISGNNLRNNTAGSIGGTYASSTVFGTNKHDTSNQITAAATTMTLRPHSDFFYVLGDTGITSIPASWPGRFVTLEFDGTPTVTDGGNLRLAGDFTPGFMDTLNLRSDGSAWIEVSRSGN